MRLLALSAVILVGVFAAFVTASTGAVFTDLAASSASAFTAGTLDLKLNGGDSTTAQYNLTNMAPGDGQVVQTKMTNTGNLALRYALTMAASTGALYDTGTLTWKVRSLGVGGACAVGSEPEAANTFDFVGGPGWSVAIATIGTGSTPTITTSAAHGLSTGQQVVISGSNTAPVIDGRYSVTSTGANTFTISGVTVTGAGSAGVVTIPVQVTAIGTGSAPLITAAGHGLINGMSVTIAGSDSTPSVDGTYTVSGVSGNSFTISGVTVTGSGSHGIVTGDLSITGNSQANPTVVTTGAAHNLSTGDQVIITGSNSTPSINGLWTVTKISATTFSIAVNVTVAGTAGTITRNIVGTGGSTGYVAATANGGAVFGSNAQGRQTTPNGGDRVIDSAARADVLCFKVVLPLSTPGTPGQSAPAGFQGATGTLNFQFDAEQTVNNP